MRQMRASSWSRRAIGSGLAAVLLAGAPQSALAQSARPSLFSEASREPASRLTMDGAARARRLSVRADLLAAALAPGAADDAPFTLNLFPDVTLTLVRERLERGPRGLTTWSGHVRDERDSLATLTWDGRMLTGGVVSNGVAYDLSTGADGVVSVSQRTVAETPVELAPRAPARFAPERAPLVATAGDAGTAAIDLLVLYTPAAKVRAGGESQMQAQLANAVAVTNTAFQRSGVNAVVTAVGIQELAYVEGTGLGSDLTAISLGGAMSATVEARRQALGADLVALVTGRASSSGGCGLAWLGPSASAAYSASEQTCLYAGQWSFSHELGHNLGADHAPGDSSPIGASYAHGYRDAGVRTLMAYAVYGSPLRALNYSNPNVTESGVVTGSSLQDNARRLNETVATVGGYVARVGGGPAVPAAPSGLNVAVTGTNIAMSWGAVTSATSYVVQIGRAPGDASVYTTEVTTATLSGPIPPGSYYWRVIAKNASGASPASADGSFTVVASAPAPPMQPQGLAVDVNGLNIVMSWGATASATSYIVQIGRAAGDASVYTTEVTTTSIAGPIPAGTYYWRVIAKNAAGAGATSADASFSVGSGPSAPPAAPSGFTASVSGSTVSVSFVPGAGGNATSYALEAGPTPGSALYGAVMLTQTSAAIPNVPNGTYYLRVRAVGPGGTSAPTADVPVTVGQACQAPGVGTLTSSVIGGTVNLNWTAPTSGTGPFNYTLVVGHAPGGSDYGSFAMGGVLGVSSTPPAGTYYVRLVTANACGTSAPSADVTVVVP